MSRTLARFLIGLLLALVIPVQGLAAASAGVCMAMGQHEQDAYNPPAMDAGPALDRHADGEHQHQHSASDSAPEDEKSSSKAHCPPCVSCCAAAVIAPAMQPTASEQSASVAIAAMPYSVPGVLPDELDRPPLAL